MLLRYALDVAPLWNTTEEFKAALGLLPPADQALVTRFHFAADRKLALGSQILQRLVISEIHSDRKPSSSIPSLAAIPIARDPENGRPYYRSSPAREGQKWILNDYNVSHHNSRNPSLPCLVVIAARVAPADRLATVAGQRQRVGVDVVPDAHAGPESAEAFLDCFTSSEVFTSHELGAIHSPAKIEDKVKMLYLHWALKEAYVKAIGTGLVTDLLAIEFHNVSLEGVEEGGERVDRRSVRVWVGGSERNEWRLEVGRLANGHYFAIATDGNEGGDEGEGTWRWIEFGKDVWEVWGYLGD